MVNIKMKCLLAVLAVLLVIVNAHGPGPGYWPQRRRSSNETASMQSRAVDTTVHFEVAEGEPSNTLVGFIPTKPGFRYRFNEPLREFSLDPVTGEIRTNSELDRESLVSDHYDLVILSSQPTYPIEVRIYVLDVNDNSPHFPEPVIAVTFSESNPPGTRILLDAATDADIGVNSVTDDYQIIGGNDEGKFRLAVTTNPSGDVSYLHLETTGSLDRESRAFYVLNISAKDGGIPQHMGYLQVNVTVLDVNDNPPIFDHSDYIVSLNESVLPGTHVLQVMATDSDLGENAKIVYYLADTESQFAVDPETGHIRTVDKISCPLQDCPEFGASRTQCHKSCVFTVFARDHGSPRQDGRTYVTINLLDTNDHDPAIKFQYFPSTSSHATVDENAANGTVVAAISVDDMDEGPNGRTSLEIVAGNEQGHFRLEATTSFYLVRVNSVLDREEINKYNLTVVAVDDGTPQRTTIAHLIILVNDVNDHEPVFEKSEYSVTLSELVPPGSFVASIVAKDEDTGVNAQVLYSFVSGNQQNWFSIIQESGLIMTNAVLDREQQDTILLNISAHDGGPNPKYAFAQLKITLLDENDEAPKFVKADVVMNLPEDAPAGSHVATLTAFDADQGTNGSVTYELTNFQKVFSLDSNTGRLITAQPLDRETVSRYDIRVVARDHGTPAQQSEARISLLVNDINDNTPIFYPHTYYTILDDDSEVGASIAKISAHDPDEGFNSLLKYSIQSGDDTSLFALNSSTGLLTLKTKISNYPGSSYDLIFSVIDGGNRRAKRSASLKIIKKSKAKIIDMPVVYEFEVSENDLANVGNLWSDEVAFFIVDGDLQESFRIEKGILSLVKPLDREMSSLYNLQVVANDGLYYGVTRVLVKVLDVNDNAPTFKKTLDKVLIDEDTAVGALLYDAKAVDADESEVTYSLQGSVGKIDHNGLIILNRPIREDPGTELKLEISATDGQFTSSMTLLIVVRDVNDHTPIFDHTTYETSLIESTSVNTRFFALMASDADQGENSRVVFEIMEGNSEDKFGLFPDGHLYVKNALDREERSYYSLSVTCRDMGSPSRSSVVPMVIHVIDDNDNPPIFTNETFVFRIAENEPSNSFVGKLRATDRDVGRNAELIYMIADLQSDFMVDPRNGFIKTLKSFDRELLMEQGGEEIEFNVVVTDNGENARLRDRAKVKVIITDMNDNAPQFLRAPYRIQVSEGAKIGSQLLKIHTTDADSGENSVVTYKLKGPSDNFAVENGAIVLMKPLDREMTDKFTITVVAENSHARNKLQNETTVSIEVLDENDNAPEFAHTTTFASIEENRPVGTEIIRFRALDTDSGDNARLHFAIFSGNKRDAFVINSKTGVVSLNRPLDYEDTAVYQLNITCSDYGQPPLVSSLLFKIYVIDVNDNPPNFPSTAIVRQIREGITIGTKIVTVLAEDPDSGVNGKIRYSIVMQEPADGYFAINFTSGIIHTLRAIDRESIDTFKITVRAVDQGTPSLSAKKLVTVIVEDVNDNAPQFTSMNTAIVESAEAESVIQVSARDLDSSTNGLVSFEIVTGDASIFSISRNTGVLTLRKPLPGGRGRKFELMVRATDEAAQNERKSTDSYLTVFRVGDEGERPVFEQHSLAGSVYENEPIGTSILKVTAKGKNVEYYVTNVTRNGRQMERLFDISQGVLSTANIIDREAGDSYDVEISAVSMGDVITTTKTTIKIQILDRNDCAPRFDSNRLEFNTNEDALVGHIVGKISAIDEDTFGTLTYSIISGGGDLFSIDTTDGSLKLADTLDREQNDEHEFIVQVSDGSHFSNATIVVKVTDANDNAPIFEKLTYSFEVPENATRGFKVGGIRATDREIGANAQISYNVVSNWANDVFTLDPTSGLFTLISNLDYEEVPHYILIVQAQDAGTPQLTSTATVYCNVLDLNDNAPLFNQKSFFSEILENTPIGSEVLVVSASDADSGENGRINFSIVEGDEEQQFEIFESGSIKTVKMLDRETRASYNLVVQIEDNGAERLSSTTQVTITLKDINDQSPEFTSMNEVYVMENSPVNTIVTVVMAFDRDEGTNSRVTYSLASDVPVPFTLGSIDGVLKVAGPLDRELRSGYEVQVTARDGGAPALATTLNLTVNILDENDNSPVFDPRQYSAAIAENASIGASVMQVSATDTDEGANGQIRYSIISGDENQDFSISEDTGVVRVARNINYERKSRYNLVVKAEDRANDVGKFEARYDTADLIILITDINDNAPTFYDSPYMAYVMEDTQLPNEGYFLTVTALDADTPPLNNQVRYFLKEGNADLFYVNASTGDISLRTTLDREQAYEHVLTIIAMDTGSPPLTGTGTVLVSVMDINDNKPEFEKKEYSAKVMENIDIGTEVLRVIATDKDAGLNGVVRYKLTGKYSERFSIDSRGFIKTAAEIDREEIGSYDLEIKASDSSATCQLKSSVSLKIIVEDVNDNSPHFPRDLYKIYIPNQGRDHFVFGAHAIDPDEDKKLKYSISGPDADSFYLEDDSIVRTKAPGGHKELLLTVTASDKDNRSASTTLSVFFFPAHLFPVFQSNQRRQFTFPENIPSSKSFATITASSPKSGKAGKISYSVASGEAVSISPNGELMIRDEVGLDFETSQIYTIWIAASDSDEPSLRSIQSFQINVTDINDNAPVVITPSLVTVPEGEGPTRLATVASTDADTGENAEITFSLLDDFDSFEIDEVSGELTTVTRLDREEHEKYELVVLATDHGEPRLTGSSTIVVQVLDKNDNPPKFSRLFSVNVTENANIGSFVVRVTSIDLDSPENAQVRYSFAENIDKKFKIDPISGNVTVNGALDREQQEEYILKVMASDGAWRAETPLTITIQDQNDNAPEFEHSYYSFNFPEFQKKSAFVGQVIATDRDKVGPNSVISYSLQKPSDIFTIDPATGEMYSKRTLHYKHTEFSPENIYSFLVLATDNGKPPMQSECLVNVNIIDANNNAPVFGKRSYMAPVPLGAKYGQKVLQVEAKDTADFGVNAEISYQIVGGNGSNYFNINHNDGWISTTRQISVALGERFILSVKAFDRGIPPQYDEVIVTIIATGENRHSPVFTALSYQVIVPENEPMGSSILNVKATDVDDGLNGLVSYSISAGNERGEFEIATNGSITIAQALDFEAMPEYYLNITASDMGFLPRKTVAMLKVTLTDINDNAPTFPKPEYHAYLVENSPVNSTVLQIRATDRDSPKNAHVEYLLPKTGLFFIEKNTGVIRSRVVFDFEEESSYEIQVMAQNPGSPTMTGTTKVIVHITGVNEFVPKFVQSVFHFDVSESTEIGSAIGVIKATDADHGADGKIYYLLVGSSQEKGFSVNRDTGEIKISRHLDRETQSRVVLTVMAKNFGSIQGNDTDEAQVIISIQDGNDPPAFEKSIYRVSVSEDAAKGTEVLQVSASDTDLKPQNNQFSFRILDGNINETFHVDSDGIIRTRKLLDRETIPHYTLLVGAIDTGVPPATGTATVLLDVTDVNDNGPMFEPENLIGYVTENEPAGTSIMTLNAYDIDIGGTPFTYRLIGGTHQQLVTLDPAGLLKTSRPLDRERIQELSLIVEVEDSGGMRSQHKVVVHVEDQNDSPSTNRHVKVLALVYKGHILPDTVLADVRPNDPDTTGDYRCKLADSRAFRIKNACFLSTTGSTQLKNYTLSVTGNDGRHANVVSTIEITFSKFNEKHVENAIIVRVEEMTADDFLTSYFQTFVNLVKMITGRLTIFSIREETDGVEIFLSIEEKSAATVSEALTKKYDQLVEQLHKKVIVGYSKCSKVGQCENEGVCRSKIIVQHNELITVSSESLILTSPRAETHFECVCTDGFIGDRCEKRLNPCNPNPCQAGGQCRHQGYDFQCYCPPDRDGKLCEIKKSNMCLENPCQNGGSCHADGTNFFCLCRTGYRGSRCEFVVDTCRPNPCMNGGKCVALKPGYKCSCATGFYGPTCDQRTFAFNELSFLEFPSLEPSTNDIAIVFATTKPNVLLAYNFGMAIGGRSDFVALELIAGKAVFSFGGAQTAITSLVVGRNGETFADGKWHKIIATRNGKVVSLSVSACKSGEDSCEECRVGDEKCYTDDIGPASTLNFNKNSLFIGGLASAEPILERPGQIHTDDFIGCVQSISINGRFMDLTSALHSENVEGKCSRPEAGLCSSSSCGNFPCIDRWSKTMCNCGDGSLAPNCQSAIEPVSFSEGNFLEMKVSAKHQRMQLLNSIYTENAWTHKLRRRRATNSTMRWHLDRDVAPKTLSLTFKTVKPNGVLFFAATGKYFTLVEVQEGQLAYHSVNQGGIVLKFRDEKGKGVADGAWHTMKLTMNQEGFGFWLDKRKLKDNDDVHDFLDPYLTEIFLGGVLSDDLPVGVEVIAFEGCMANFTVQNEIQPFEGDGSIFKTSTQHGKIYRGCFDLVKLGSSQVTDPLSVGLSLVIGFVIILLVATAVSFLFFKFHKHQREKSGPPVAHKQGSALLSGEMGRVHGMNDVLSHGDFRSTHHFVGPEIISKKYKDREVASIDSGTQRSQRPDIIEREVVKTASLQRGGDEHQRSLPPHEHTTSNLELEEFNEHYDLDNTNSIAPYHYKGYRDGGAPVRKFKASPLSMPGYHHKHTQQQHRHSPHHPPGPFRVPPQQSSVNNSRPPHQSTPLARLSPSSELSSQHPRILTLHDISGKPLQSALLATTSSSGGVGKDVLHSNSERSLNSPVMSQLSAESSSASRKPPKPAPSDMLTAEELERLNVRPRTSSLVSTLDAVSCSSERVGVGGPSHHLHHSQNVDASSTSSDESGNDSFTCSEIEYDNNSINGDSSSKYKSDSMPQNDCGTEAASNKPESTYDGFDSSFRGSLSTLVASDDDLSSHIGNIYRQPAPGAPTEPMGWEYLLNWGPNFESLVGVFKDIAELPDTANGVNALRLANSHPKPSEEYV